ncbi:MAG: EAL domain-containing protein, partial [Exilibacterium sp.]
NGETFPTFLSISAVRDDAGKLTNYIGISSDISQHKEAEKHIRQLAYFDALTGLPNRALLNDRIEQVLTKAQRNHSVVALMFLDLDRFKNINDSLGHRMGDAVLIETAKRIKMAVREADTVSRLGGDEFILVLSEADNEGVAHVAEKVIQAITKPFYIANHELSVSPSIGISMYPVDGINAETLVQSADSAMYRAKQSGRNTYRFFTPEMYVHANRILQLENALRQALNQHQLQLYFQPQQEIHTGNVVGCEALLRWNHPTFGMVSPTEFVPIAEDSGQIPMIGEWVLRSAVKQIKVWERAGLPLVPVAVNLSVAQFRQLNLNEIIIQILKENSLAPKYLELELTETIPMEDPAAAIDITTRLHQSGIKLSIDDFGTGYSSLSYLKRLNIHKLKIDQSFVRDIATDPEDEEIVRAIIGLAKSLKMRTIAEGVETIEQLEILRAQGCDEIQGFYYSKPLTAMAFEQLLRRNQTQAANCLASW